MSFDDGVAEVLESVVGSFRGWAEGPLAELLAGFVGEVVEGGPRVSAAETPGSPGDVWVSWSGFPVSAEWLVVVLPVGRAVRSASRVVRVLTRDVGGGDAVVAGWDPGEWWVVVLSTGAGPVCAAAGRVSVPAGPEPDPSPESEPELWCSARWDAGRAQFELSWVASSEDGVELSVFSPDGLRAYEFAFSGWAGSVFAGSPDWPDPWTPGEWRFKFHDAASCDEIGVVSAVRPPAPASEPVLSIGETGPGVWTITWSGQVDRGNPGIWWRSRRVGAELSSVHSELGESGEVTVDASGWEPGGWVIEAGHDFGHTQVEFVVAARPSAVLSYDADRDELTVEWSGFSAPGIALSWGRDGVWFGADARLNVRDDRTDGVLTFDASKLPPGEWTVDVLQRTSDGSEWTVRASDTATVPLRPVVSVSPIGPRRFVANWSGFAYDEPVVIRMDGGIDYSELPAGEGSTEFSWLGDPGTWTLVASQDKTGVSASTKFTVPNPDPVPPLAVTYNEAGQEVVIEWAGQSAAGVKFVRRLAGGSAGEQPFPGEDQVPGQEGSRAMTVDWWPGGEWEVLAWPADDPQMRFAKSATFIVHQPTPDDDPNPPPPDPDPDETLIRAWPIPGEIRDEVREVLGSEIQSIVIDGTIPPSEFNLPGVILEGPFGPEWWIDEGVISHCKSTIPIICGPDVAIAWVEVDVQTAHHAIVMLWGDGEGGERPGSLSIRRSYLHRSTPAHRYGAGGLHSQYGGFVDAFRVEIEGSGDGFQGAGCNLIECCVHDLVVGPDVNHVDGAQVYSLPSMFARSYIDAWPTIILSRQVDGSVPSNSAVFAMPQAAGIGITVEDCWVNGGAYRLHGALAGRWTIRRNVFGPDGYWAAWNVRPNYLVEATGNTGRL